MPRNILISAGEASGDLYAALLVDELRRIWPDAQFFGCTGSRMRRAGVETIVDAAGLAVVGLIEVVAHIPRIYGEYRRLLSAARSRRPLIRASSPRTQSTGSSCRRSANIISLPRRRPTRSL